MRRSISTNNKKGFSLIELCIVLIVFSILAGSITPIFIKGVEIKAGEKTALEMSSIQQAASAYFVANNAWPASIQALQSAGYLNPSWSAVNPWANAYTISSNSIAFTVSTTVPQEWTGLVARDLPTSSISGTSVGSTVPAPTQNNSLPTGSIVIWSGTVASIPSGWQLCDGSNGTPDLRDRFVVGARQDSGSVPVTDVSGTLTQIGGEAKHTLTIDEMPAHTHTINCVQNLRGGGGDGQIRADGGPTRSTNSTGGGQPHNILPPYYALCYIMKIS